MCCLSSGFIGCTEQIVVLNKLVLCVLQGYDTCAYLKWVDKEWQGRPRQVIGKLAEEDVALQKFVFDKDVGIMRLKEERKAMIMKHKKEIRTRDRREIWLACLVCFSALLYGVVACNYEQHINIISAIFLCKAAATKITSAHGSSPNYNLPL